MFDLSKLRAAQEAKGRFPVSACHLIIPNVWKLYLKILKVKCNRGLTSLFVLLSDILN